MPETGNASLNAPAGLDVGLATDVGRVREANEDSLLALAPGDGKLLVAVADGMGGHKAGEVASDLAVKPWWPNASEKEPTSPEEAWSSMQRRRG